VVVHLMAAFAMSEFAWLCAWALLFVLQHLGITSSGLRTALVGRVGEKAYLGVYSLLSIVIFVLLVRAYNDSLPSMVFWPTFEWMRVLALCVMPVALFLLIGGLVHRNPSTVGVVLDDGEEVPVTGVMRITRHPVQSAILIWSLTHVLVNPDPPSLVFFGAIALVSGYGMRLIDQRKQAVFGASWQAFSEATSAIPFVAVASGRQSLRLKEIGVLAPALTLFAYFALWWGHAYVSGVSLVQVIQAANA